MPPPFRPCAPALLAAALTLACAGGPPCSASPGPAAPDEGGEVREVRDGSDPPPPGTYPWPFSPQSRPHPVAHHYHSIYRPRTETAYIHGGVDLPAPAGTPALAVARGRLEVYEEGGFDNAILTEPGGDVWEYRHLARGSTPTEVLERAGRGESIDVGEKIGEVGRWAMDYSHLHLNRRTADGCIVNPLSQLLSVRDTTPPEIRGVHLVADGTDAPVEEREGRPLVRGPVDIVVDAIDRIDGSPYGSPPIEVRLRWGPPDDERRLAFRPFRRRLPRACELPVPRRPREGVECFVRQGPLASKNRIPADPEQRFCLIVTNLDEEGRPDAAGAWDPGGLEDGVHTIHVEALDEAGNRSETSISIEIARP